MYASAHDSETLPADSRISYTQDFFPESMDRESAHIHIDDAMKPQPAKAIQVLLIIAFEIQNVYLIHKVR